MAVMTHDTKWRLLVGIAPVIGVALFVWAVAQGDADVARSIAARAILAVVAALGTAVAWYTARQLRSASTMPVARAVMLARDGRLSGLVALRGRAQALPDAVPLISPDGELCLWFEHSQQFEEQGSARDSVRPFLLVDDSGECIVLPAGAQVTGQGQVRAMALSSGFAAQADIASLHDAQASERVLRNGDRIRVVGRFVAASAETLTLQAEAPLAGQGLPLPVIAAPGASQPFSIRIGIDEGEGSLYGTLAVVDCLVLVVASSLAAWSMLVPG